MAQGQAIEVSETAGTGPPTGSREWRSVIAVALLVLEVFFLRRAFTTDHLMGLGFWWTRLLVLTRFGMPFSLSLMGGMALASGRSFLDHYKGQRGPGSWQRRSFPWARWVGLHVVCLAACLGTANYLFQPQPDTVRWLGLCAAGFVLSVALLLISLVALVVPLRGFAGLLWAQRLRLPLGLFGGLLAYGVGDRLLGDMPFWRPMGAGTMWLAYHMLGLVYPERILQPEYLRIGTPEFDVMISRWCSGYEGTFLFLGFFSMFLFLKRRSLRFPQVFWLLPVGVVSVYLLNGLRIALLVVVGTEFSQELAMEGFHVNAGWPFFGITAWLAVLVGMRCSYFSESNAKRAQDPQLATVNLYAVYAAPLVVAIAAVMLSGSVTRMDWVGDLLKLLGVLWVLWHYRREYRGLLASPSRWGVLFGVLAFGAWSLLFQGEPSERWELELLIPRVIGFALVTPLAEELFFRGFLMRRLVAAKFERVNVCGIGLWPLAISSLVFGALHEQWLAGTVCGLIFGLAYRKRGRLSDALVAHVLTNAALLVAAQISGDWGRVS